MKKWRSGIWAIAALMVLFASGLPALAWSCPITKRIGDASFVCQGMNQQCAGMAASCCKRVQVPSSGASVTLQPTRDSRALLAKSSSRFVIALYSAWNAQQSNAFLSQNIADVLRRRVDIPARAAPSFGLCAQQGSPSMSGRAPPFAVTSTPES